MHESAAQFYSIRNYPESDLRSGLLRESSDSICLSENALKGLSKAMPRMMNKTARKQLKLPLLGVSAGLALLLPSAGLAVVGFAGGESLQGESAQSAAAYDLFTPASVDPELAARIADKARERGISFTPAGTNRASDDRTVTVAVRIDAESAKAISVRTAADLPAGKGTGLAALQTSRFNLGTARGYQSFARARVEAPSQSGVSLSDALRSNDIGNLRVPDLADFEPARSSREDKPSRLQPRIELEDEQIAGRSPNTLDSLGSQTVDVGGSFRLSPNLNVTAGVRYSQERERLNPLTNSLEDSQAVYVGTQIRF